MLTALLAVWFVALVTAGALLAACITCQAGTRVVRRLVTSRRAAAAVSHRRVQVS